MVVWVNSLQNSLNFTWAYPGYPKRAKLIFEWSTGMTSGRVLPVAAQKFFIFLQFLGKIDQIIVYRTLPWSWWPPDLGNLGSASETWSMRRIISCSQMKLIFTGALWTLINLRNASVLSTVYCSPMNVFATVNICGGQHVHRRIKFWDLYTLALAPLIFREKVPFKFELNPAHFWWQNSGLLGCMRIWWVAHSRKKHALSTEWIDK